MGDLQSWPPKRNATLIDASLSPSPSPPRSNPHPSSIGDDIWRRAENAAGDIVRRFQPTMASERKRNAVIEHLQWLIKAYVGGEESFSRLSSIFLRLSILAFRLEFDRMI
ncbi:hypothetical protein ACLOJK_012183 [Asimina triloba]